MREYYEDVDGRNFNSSIVVWFCLRGRSCYVKFIILKRLHYEYGNTYIESGKDYTKYF